MAKETGEGEEARIARAKRLRSEIETLKKGRRAVEEQALDRPKSLREQIEERAKEREPQDQ